MPNTAPNEDLQQLSRDIKQWGLALGFQQVGISDIRLDEAEAFLNEWLTANHHGDMHFMEKHGTKRSRPDELVPETLRVISVRMDYYPEASMETALNLLEQPDQAYISRYTLGRDYHKVLRNRLKKLIANIQAEIDKHQYRAFVDSAPVLEKAIAEKAGLGWIGKHTNLINKRAGSWFFLGEIYTSLPLVIDEPEHNHCGTCESCIQVCPTQAIIAPYKLDARRCISYLTIELKDSIPEEFRAQIGNRIYGCDDCQLFCPWNKFASLSCEGDFTPRHQLDQQQLIDLFNWDETTFLSKTEGSAIRRIKHSQWLRNIAVALGNAPHDQRIIDTLSAQLHQHGDMVDEHIQWALQQQYNKAAASRIDS